MLFLRSYQKSLFLYLALPSFPQINKQTNKQKDCRNRNNKNKITNCSLTLYKNIAALSKSFICMHMGIVDFCISIHTVCEIVSPPQSPNNSMLPSLTLDT